jgi:hypothetical protein
MISQHFLSAKGETRIWEKTLIEKVLVMLRKLFLKEWRWKRSRRWTKRKTRTCQTELMRTVFVTSIKNENLNSLPYGIRTKREK